MKVVKQSLAQRVIALIELARQKVGAAVDIAHVYTNYEIGRMIVEEEQGGKSRADYGKKILIDVSNQLTSHFGRGYSVDNLERMRTFFLMYSPARISASDLRKLGNRRKSASDLRKSRRGDSLNADCPIGRFALSWSHYLVLMRIADVEKREFYERAAVEGTWKLEQMSRQKVSPAAEKWDAKTLRRNKKDRKIADREYAEAVALERNAESANCRGE